MSNVCPTKSINLFVLVFLLAIGASLAVLMVLSLTCGFMVYCQKFVTCNLKISNFTVVNLNVILDFETMMLFYHSRFHKEDLNRIS